MTCPACQHENRESAKFCEECGRRLSRRCPACDTELRPTARFCDECGAAIAAAAGAAPPVMVGSAVGPAPASPPVAVAAVDAQPSVTTIRVAEVAANLVAKIPGYTPKHLADKILTSRSALEGERKQVTVLFADCVGFTELARAIGPEALHEVMDGCFRRLLDVVHHYEGTVNQFTGDGVMALFGAPIAHENHAVGAAAALAIQARLAEYARGLRRERGIEFALRIGLNTGPVVVGRIGDDLRMGYTAQGETVNLAARLQQAAPPGAVLVSAATHRLISGFFRTEDAGERAVKGFDQPLRTFLVTGQRSGRARFDVSVERGLTPLVGRARELAFLRECWERTIAGQGQVVSIVGEGGVGKSRLAYEFRRSVDATAATYVEGRCVPHGTSVPFQLVVEFLNDHLGVRNTEDERERIERVERLVTRLDPALEWTVPYLKHLLALPADELDAAGLDHAQRARRLSEAVRAYVLRGAQRRPLLLLAEDLQWIDANSERFFRSLVDALATYPVLLIGTYRPGYAPPWQERSFCHRLALEALSSEDRRRMIAAVGTGLDESQRGLVLERAEGNPFFIEELSRYLRERGRAGEVPETVHDLLTARIDRLPDALKRTLQVAAVLGREFRLSLLEAVTSAPDVEAQLTDLVRHEFLRQKDVLPEPTYSFSHLLVQEVAYQGLLVKARAELHARAGEVLERLHGDRLEDVVEALAEHYARSARPSKALQYLTLSGDRAARLFAYAEAERAYTRALELTERDGDERVTLLEKIGDVSFAHGAIKDAVARWEEALAIAAEVRRRADLHRKMGGACWTAGRTADALGHLEAGLRALAEDSENLESARLHHELARIHFRLGQHGRATEWAQRALELGQRLGAADVVSHASNTLGVAMARDGDLEGGAAAVEKSLETALAHGLHAAACRAYTNLAVMYTTLDPARSERCCREGLTLAERVGDRLQQAWLYCVLAGGHCTLTGDYDEGVRAAEAAVELDQRLGQDNHLPVPLIILAQVHQCRGDHERSAHYYRRALEIAEAVREPQLLVPCYEGLATLAIERDDEREAEGWLERSREVQETTGWTSDTFLVLPFLT